MTSDLQTILLSDRIVGETASEPAGGIGVDRFFFSNGFPPSNHATSRVAFHRHDLLCHHHHHHHVMLADWTPRDGMQCKWGMSRGTLRNVSARSTNPFRYSRIRGSSPWSFAESSTHPFPVSWRAVQLSQSCEYALGREIFGHFRGRYCVVFLSRE